MLTKRILLISCYNFLFFSLTAKVFHIFDTGFLIMHRAMQKCFSFFNHVKALFNDQDFVVAFNFFSMFEKSWKCGKDLFACFVDLEKVLYDCFSIFGGF